LGCLASLGGTISSETLKGPAGRRPENKFEPEGARPPPPSQLKRFEQSEPTCEPKASSPTDEKALQGRSPLGD